MLNRAFRIAIPLGGLALLPALAQAHPGHGLSATLGAGMLHPFTGVDHQLAMLAVGMWAAQLAGRLRWLVPASFVALMVVGASLAPAGLAVGVVEQGIAASLLVCGMLLAFAVRLPVAAGALIVSGFALFHGYAHGIEAPGGAGVWPYLIGFALSTAALHALGYGLARWLQARQWQQLIRWIGAAIAACGMVLLSA